MFGSDPALGALPFRLTHTLAPMPLQGGWRAFGAVGKPLGSDVVPPLQRLCSGLAFGTGRLPKPLAASAPRPRSALVTTRQSL